MNEEAERDGPAPVVVVTGTAGVGKTAFAVRWAHRARGRFPAGQLYINLRGYDPGMPVAPAAALEGFLVALGVPARAVPGDLEARASLYRSMLADRQVLVVLDNAATVGQVRPLLPGQGRCLTLVTSRSRLSGLVARDGARRVTLEVFDELAAVQLLHATIDGYRQGDEDGQVAELARLCARLPLALRIAAERAAARPYVPLDALIQDLRDESSLWDALSSDDEEEADAVRAVFAWSYRALPAPAARLFRLLGLHPTPEFSMPAAAALAGLGVGETRALLDTLVGTHLIEQTGPERYQFHDLLRAYALDQVHQHDTPEQQHAALERVLAWYLHTADALAASDVDRSHRRLSLALLPDAVRALRFADHTEALDWFTTERANLAAAVRAAADAGLDQIAWQLPATLRGIYGRHNFFEDWFTSGRLGLEAARRLGESTGVALLCESLGMACRQSQRYAEAVAYHGEAMEIYRENGDRIGQAQSLNVLGLTHLDAHRLRDAQRCFEQSLELCRQEEGSALTGWVLNNLARACTALGRPQEALARSRQALELFAQTDDLYGQSDALRDLAEAAAALGSNEEAAAWAGRALGLARQVRSPMVEGYILLTYGKIQQAGGAHDLALESYHRAVVIHRQLGDRGREADALDLAAIAYRSLHRLEEAIKFHRRAAAILRGLDTPWQLAVALKHLADALHDNGDEGEARACRQDALELLARFDDPRAAAARAAIGAALAAT